MYTFFKHLFGHPLKALNLELGFQINFLLWIVNSWRIDEASAKDCVVPIENYCSFIQLRFLRGSEPNTLVGQLWQKVSPYLIWWLQILKRLAVIPVNSFQEIARLLKRVLKLLYDYFCDCWLLNLLLEPHRGIKCRETHSWLVLLGENLAVYSFSIFQSFEVVLPLNHLLNFYLAILCVQLRWQVKCSLLVLNIEAFFFDQSCQNFRLEIFVNDWNSPFCQWFFLCHLRSCPLFHLWW